MLGLHSRSGEGILAC